MIGAFCVCTLLTSCSKGDEDAPQSNGNTNNGGAEINFSPNVVGSTVVEVKGRGISTRGPLDVFEENSPIGIFGIPAVEGGKNENCNLRDCKFESDFQPSLFNGKYTYVSGYDQLQSEYQACYPAKANPALYLYAYYPYVDAPEYRTVGENPAQWAVPWKLETTDMSKTIDYLYTGETISNYSTQGLSPVVLHFLHVFGRIDFLFYTTNSSVMSKNYQVKSVSINCDTGKDGWMAVGTGKLSFTSEKIDCHYPVTKGSLTYNSPSNVAAQFMFPPEQTLINKITCKVLSGAGTETEHLIYEAGAPGYNYTIPVKRKQITTMKINFLPKDVVYSSDAKIESWEKGVILDVNVKLQ